MASSLEVLLLESVDNLGRVGDVVRVPSGYARNFLIPGGKAARANKETIRIAARRRAKIEAEEAAILAEANRVVEALQGVSISTSLKADENGHLFGSVNAAGIAQLLSEQGFAVEEKQVRLDQPIKTTGSHAVTIHVRGDANAEITLDVQAAAE